MIETYTDVVNWLLVALGAAMGIGTGVALLHHRRTGSFPGQPLDDDGEPVEPPALTTAWAKVGIGGLLALWGLVGLTADRVIGF